VNWSNFQKSRYEPDTIAFLAKYVDENSVFFDCGAAVGAMSLVSASLGAQVIAYEPMEHIHQLALTNIGLNPKYKSRIELKNYAIGNSEVSISIIGKPERRILSEIVSSKRNFQDKPIKVLDLKKEIKETEGKAIVLKIDIEGAEFDLLSDIKLLNLLKKRKAICILALHPGFSRPVRGKGIRALRMALWRFRNFLDCYILFKRITGFGEVKRSNEAIVDSPMKFGLLSAAGVYEYILDFSH
jgi:FkbM family methyltransferase